MRMIFLKIKYELGKAYEVAESVVPTVDKTFEVYSTSGNYGLMAKCYLQDDTEVGGFVTELGADAPIYQIQLHSDRFQRVPVAPIDSRKADPHV